MVTVLLRASTILLTVLSLCACPAPQQACSSSTECFAGQSCVADGHGGAQCVATAAPPVDAGSLVHRDAGTVVVDAGVVAAGRTLEHGRVDVGVGESHNGSRVLEQHVLGAGPTSQKSGSRTLESVKR